MSALIGFSVGDPGTAIDDPVGDPGASIDFLRRWHGDDPITIVAIDPDLPDGNPEKIKRRDFAPGDTDGLRKTLVYLGERGLNVYTQVNRCAPGSRKPGKVDMWSARAFHIDADLKDLGCDLSAAIARAKAFDPPPSVINFSGNGIWALWLLTVPDAEPDGSKNSEAASARR